jgi:biotin operon repressor
MARGLSKQPRQAEKLLLILLDGHEAGLQEIETTLGGLIEVYRLSTYLWNLKKWGADIRKVKAGRKVVGIQLLNTDAMATYAQTRGLLAAQPTQLKPEDLMVATA